jgi:hypothetical protein
MRDLNIDRAGTFRRNGLRKIHRESDSRKDELILREVDPVLITDIRTIDADVDVEYGNGMKLLRVVRHSIRRIFKQPEKERERKCGDQVVVSFFTAVGKPNRLLLRIDRLDVLSQT